MQNTDLEEFMALEKLKQQEAQLKETMIWSGRRVLWSDWQKYQAQARKSRRVQEALAKKQREEFVRALMIFVGIVAGIAGVVGLIIWGSVSTSVAMIYKYQKINKMRQYNLMRKRDRKVNSTNFQIWKRNQKENLSC